MLLKIQKWGNSLGIRIPATFAREAEIRNGSPVNVSVSGGAIVVKKAAPNHTLEELLSGVTQDNIHSEVYTSAPCGKEAW